MLMFVNQVQKEEWQVLSANQIGHGQNSRLLE